MADVAPGIRDDLAAAIASVETPEEPAEAVQASQEPEAPEEGAETETPSGERLRGPDGKFVAKGATEGPKDQAPKEEAAATEPVEQPEPAQAAKPDPTARWSDADKAMYKSLPKEAQDFVQRRYREMEADHTKKTQAIAEFKKTYDPVDQMFTPFKPQMQAQGWTIPSLIKAWADVEQDLMKGNGANVIARIVRDYKVDPKQLAQAIGLQTPSAEAKTEAPQAAQFAPEVAAALEGKFGSLINPLKQQLDALTNELTQRQQAALRQDEQRAMSTLQSFIDAKDDKGNALHPYYSEVEGQMVVLARAERQAGRVPDLNQIYDQAVWATPQTREKLLAAQTAALEAKARDEARAKAAAAKKASSSVTGAPTSGQTPQMPSRGPKSLREELLEAHEAIEAA